MAPLLAAYAALLLWRPRYWLFALPLLLPVLDLAPRTGWFVLEEIDLLILLTAAIGYWRLAASSTPSAAGAQASRAALPGWLKVGAALLLVASVIGMWRGMNGLPPFDANAAGNYLGPYNALRVGKPYVWMVILMPLLREAAGPELAGLRRYFIPGMLAGLSMAALAALWERASFPGLLNFSSDYRITAPFSAMHTGGAALDAYLALSLPLLACWLAALRSGAQLPPALCLFALALYAALASFSRGLYLALAVALLCLMLCACRQAMLTGRIGWRRIGLAVLGCALVAMSLQAMFAVSGYRGLAAALALLAAGFLLWVLPESPAPPRFAQAQAAFMLVLLVCLSATLYVAAPASGWSWLKPPYAFFTCCTALFAAAQWRRLSTANTLAAPAWSMRRSALSGMATGMVWIAWHWAGAASLPAAALVLALALGLAYGMRRHIAPPTLSAQGWTAIAVLALLTAMAIPVAGSYYASERFSTARADWQQRLRHWRLTLNMMNSDDATALFGMGLGTFPATYFWHNPLGEVPAAFSYERENGKDGDGANRFLRLRAGTYSAGYGELLRMLQRVELQPYTPYLLSFDVRTLHGGAFLHINLCERQLLYPQNCIPLPLQSLTAASGWQSRQLWFSSGPAGHAWLRSPQQFEIAVEGEQAVVDVDKLSLKAGADATELLRNGGFERGNDFWFFSSDRHHLPWHTKNLALNLYFETGWLGLFGFCFLVGAACLHLLRRAWHGDMAAASWLAAILAFLTVGLFDSLLDVPRIGLLFFLLLSCACLQTNPLSEGK